MPMIRPALAALVALVTLAAPAHAEMLTQDQVLRADLLTGWQEPDGSRIVGLRLDLAPGWKTYWRSPGDTGIPPEFDWTGSSNLKGAAIHWPVPSVFHLNGMQSIGYHDGVVLPIRITPKDPAQPVELRARVDLGVCKDICMPAALELDSLLSGRGAPDPAIRAALADQPKSGAEAGLARIACRVEPAGKGLLLRAEMDLPAAGATETVVFEPGQPGLWIGEATSWREGDRLVAETEVEALAGGSLALDRSTLTVTVLAGAGGVEIRGCPAD